MLEETEAIANGGFYKAQSMSIQSPICAQAQIRFCDLTGFNAQKVAFQEHGPNEFILPIQEIHTSLNDAPLAPNPFAISRIYQGGVTHFSYLKAYPLHVLMVGSLKLYVRLADFQNENLRRVGMNYVLPPNLSLHLCSTTRPTADGILGYQISVDSVWQPRKLFKLNPHGYYRIPMPSYDRFTRLLRQVESKKVEITQGSIAKNSISPGKGNQKEGNLLTSWFSIEGESHLWLKTNGNSNICRIQWQDEFGKIYYDNNTDEFTYANVVIKVPHFAVFGRIYFNEYKKNQQNTTTVIQIKSVPKKLDPYYGVWAEYNFYINTLNYFNPNTEYYFLLKANDGQDWSLDQDGFICVQSGIHFQLNVRDELQEAFDRLSE